MQPLASILRPENLENFVWQQNVISQIQNYIKNWQLPSMIFRWPPGVWKTTLAKILSTQLNADFFQLSWVSSKKSDLESIISLAQKNKAYWKSTILFLDEIHRWTKAQQDALLPYVEEWDIILIWATTENPSFSINNALLSRSKLILFENHSSEDIFDFFAKNIEKIKSNFSNVDISQENLKLISKLANGDLRNGINILEASLMWKSWKLENSDILKSFNKPVYYDKDWDEHYNIISAVHKSLRDSDENAACYWVQRMLSGWEDPLYICRRLLRFASEDIWLADNNALLLANQVFDTCHKLGMPECQTAIFQLVIYLARAKKSNLCYKVANETKKDVEEFWNLPVPLHLRNASNKTMKNIGYGAWYKYAHDYENAKVDQEHFPEQLKGRKYIE